MQTFTRGGYPHLFCLVSFAISRTPAEDTTSGPECGVEFSVLPKSILTNCNIDLKPPWENPMFNIYNIMDFHINVSLLEGNHPNLGFKQNDEFKHYTV